MAGCELLAFDDDDQGWHQTREFIQPGATIRSDRQRAALVSATQHGRARPQPLLRQARLARAIVLSDSLLDLDARSFLASFGRSLSGADGREERGDGEHERRGASSIHGSCCPSVIRRCQRSSSGCALRRSAMTDSILLGDAPCAVMVESRVLKSSGKYGGKSPDVAIDLWIWGDSKSRRVCPARCPRVACTRSSEMSDRAGMEPFSWLNANCASAEASVSSKSSLSAAYGAATGNGKVSEVKTNVSSEPGNGCTSTTPRSRASLNSPLAQSPITLKSASPVATRFNAPAQLSSPSRRKERDKYCTHCSARSTGSRHSASGKLPRKSSSYSVPPVASSYGAAPATAGKTLSSANNVKAKPSSVPSAILRSSLWSGSSSRAATSFGQSRVGSRNERPA